jgi:hypothetical protein
MLVISDMLLTVFIVAFTLAAVSELHIGIIFFCDAAGGAFMNGLDSCGIFCHFDVPPDLLGLASSVLHLHEPRTEEKKEVQ